MANPEHLKILKQGAEQWNKWRKERPDLRPDLDEAELRGVNLRGADLRQANLSGANLSSAKIMGTSVGKAWLIEADLSDADLIGADLSGANLEGANLHRADLSGANLSGANLRMTVLVGADLSGVNLSGATLSWATLVGAHLSKVDLRKANLFGANFREADLRGADLSGRSFCGANLREADLTEANLCGTILAGAVLVGADLYGANLRGADLSNCRIGYAKFANVDLSATKGLEIAIHNGPITVDIDTIYKSHGKIPEVFLRGCSVPDDFIAYIGSMLGRPVEYYSCFVSYSSLDQEFGERLHADLQAKGALCWFEPHDIKGGRKLHEQIDEAIRLHDKLLLILSEHSMTSEWVKTELAKARKREVKEGKRVLFPVRLVGFEALRDWECFDADTGKDSAREIREYFIPDFSNWKEHDSYQTAFQRLVKDLKQSG